MSEGAFCLCKLKDTSPGVVMGIFQEALQGSQMLNRWGRNLIITGSTGVRVSGTISGDEGGIWLYVEVI